MKWAAKLLLIAALFVAPAMGDENDAIRNQCSILLAALHNRNVDEVTTDPTLNTRVVHALEGKELEDFLSRLPRGRLARYEALVRFARNTVGMIASIAFASLPVRILIHNMPETIAGVPIGFVPAGVVAAVGGTIYGLGSLALYPIRRARQNREPVHLFIDDVTDGRHLPTQIQGDAIPKLDIRNPPYIILRYFPQRRRLEIDLERGTPQTQSSQDAHSAQTASGGE